MPAERQWRLSIERKIYFLDFAVFCKEGDLAIETDGYTTHYDSIRKIDEDTWRQNEIINDRWHLLRYTTNQVKENPAAYMAQIQTKVRQLGGIKSAEEATGRKIGEQLSEYQADEDEYFNDLD
jgi:very-short-patch-repair endonuclease